MKPIMLPCPETFAAGVMASSTACPALEMLTERGTSGAALTISTQCCQSLTVTPSTAVILSPCARPACQAAPWWVTAPMTAGIEGLAGPTPSRFSRLPSAMESIGIAESSSASNRSRPCASFTLTAAVL